MVKCNDLCSILLVIDVGGCWWFGCGLYCFISGLFMLWDIVGILF